MIQEEGQNVIHPMEFSTLLSLPNALKNKLHKLLEDLDMVEEVQVLLVI